ncbi:MAG: hypothetical protein PHE29_14065 [Tissierellia bacterium]|nr:hypothetical protein [Tissierellia bacterium]
MKREARKILSNLNDGRITVSQATEQIMYLIEQAQKEAYNQAIDDAAKSAVAYDTEPRPRFYSSCVVDEESILKLKK